MVMATRDAMAMAILAIALFGHVLPRLAMAIYIFFHVLPHLFYRGPLLRFFILKNDGILKLCNG